MARRRFLRSSHMCRPRPAEGLGGKQDVSVSLLNNTGRSVRRPSEVADEQLAELLGGKWLREVEALPQGAAEHIELGGLILGLPALGHRRYAHGMGQVDDGT